VATPASARSERALDPEERLQHALDLAYRLLSRRDRTEAQVRDHLSARAVAGAIAEQTLEELRRAGYLDDARYARRFAEDRRTLDDWGARRIEQALLRAGVARELAGAAAQDRPPEAEVDAAVELLRRRFPVAPETERDRSRALGLLVRRGFDFELACDAIRAHRRGA